MLNTKPSLPTVAAFFGSLGQGIGVNNQSGEPETDLLTGLDLRAFWATLRLRWWVIPATLALSVGFLWAQESDLRTEPGSYFVSRTFEARDPTAVLASVGIDPVSVRAFPDANNQLLVLQSATVRDEISEALGQEVSVSVSRSRPSFSLIDTLESDGQSSFVFQSAGVPTYTFTCNEPVKATCEAAIDVYVDKAMEIRRDSFAAGISDLRAVLQSVNESSPDSSIVTKLAALDVLERRLETPLVQIASVEEKIGATVAGVRRPTYTFGIAAGLVIALLILLQLTLTDSRIRSIRQVVRAVGDRDFLGTISTRQRAVSDRRTAVSLHEAVARSSGGRIRFIPLRLTPDSTVLERLAGLSSLRYEVARPYSEMAVTELTTQTASESDVLVVQKHQDLRRELAETCVAMRRSGRPFAGVVFID